jgi:hypothetical protein
MPGAPGAPGMAATLARCAIPIRKREALRRLGAFIPPPRVHRHRSHGMLAPNAPLRAALTALAREPTAAPEQPAVAQPAGGRLGGRAPARTL